MGAKRFPYCRIVRAYLLCNFSSYLKTNIICKKFVFLDGVYFDRIDYRDLIGIFVKDLIVYRIGELIYFKDRDRSGK